MANLESIVKEFIVENVPKETRKEFSIAAIHFNINLNVCSEYDLMRIDHKAQELSREDCQDKVLLTAAIYSYILYKKLNNLDIDKDSRITILAAIMSISTIITEYLTYRIDRKSLDDKLYKELKVLGI